MSDDLKINLSGSVDIPAASELRETASKRHRPLGNQPSQPAQNPLPVPVLAEPDKVITPKRAGEARESNEASESLTGDSRGGQSFPETEGRYCPICNKNHLPGQHDASVTTQEQRQPSLRPSPISGVTPPIETRWKKGQSGNPGGRARHVSRAYIKHLEEIDPATGETNADKIAKAQIKKASSEKDDGSTAAAREIRQATETDDEASKGGFNIGSLNVAILNQIQRAATGKDI